jgi:hypothetical protein
MGKIAFEYCEGKKDLMFKEEEEWEETEDREWEEEW